MRFARRWAALALLLGTALASCEPRAPRAPHVVSPPVPGWVRACADTARVWVNGARPERSRDGARLLVLWTDTDPECLERLPKLEEFAEAYGRGGVAFVGLHFAEFGFASDTTVVARAARRLRLSFASAVAGATPPELGRGQGPLVAWLAPHEQWFARFTEADAPALEARLRRALHERHPEFPLPENPLAIGDSSSLRSAGRWAWTRLGAPWEIRGPLRHAAVGRAQPFTVQFRPQEEGPLEAPVPVGWWTPRAEGLEAAHGGPANFIAFRYDGRPRIGLVLEPPPSGPTRLWVLVDEHWAKDAGKDDDLRIGNQSYVWVDAPRLYWLPGGASRHTVKLSPADPGLVIHALTFGPGASPGR